MAELLACKVSDIETYLTENSTRFKYYRSDADNARYYSATSNITTSIEIIGVTADGLPRTYYFINYDKKEYNYFTVAQKWYKIILTGREFSAIEICPDCAIKNIAD